MPDVHAKINQLDQDIRAALRKLNNRQTKFVRLIVKGTSQEQSAIKAGYAKSTARTQAMKISANLSVAHAIDLMKYRSQLEHGIDIGVKRQMLAQIADNASQKDEYYQPRSAVAAINELNKMDGDIKPLNSTHTLNVNVGLNYDIQLPGRIIEHQDEPDHPVLGRGLTLENGEDAGIEDADEAG